jgi:hypothetical protein
MPLRDWFFKDRSFHVKVVKDGPGGEVEMSPSDMAKTHFDKYKAAYFVGGSAVAVAGVTCLIMRGRYETLANGGVYGPKTADTLATMRPVFNNTPIFNNHITNVNNAGYLRKIVRCLETDEMWPQVKTAAEKTGNSLHWMSRHVNGHDARPDVNGFTYVIEGIGTTG